MTVLSDEGRFDTDTQAEIKEAIENAMISNIDDPDLTDGSIYDSLAAAYAEVLASEQETAMQSVYNAAFLDTATDKNLEKVVSLLGLQRRAAVHATGTIQFTSSNVVTQTHNIAKGTTVQTDETDAVQFDTTEAVALSFYDGYEDSDPLADYTGGNNYTVETANPESGSQHLRSSGASDDKLDGSASSIGKTHVLHVYFDSANSGTAGHYARLRYLSNPNDTADADYVEVNENTGTIKIVSENDGQIASTSVTIPTDEYLQIRATPNEDLTVDAAVYDSSGSLVGETSGSITEHARNNGEVGIGVGRSNIDIDTLTTKAVSADIRAVDGGSDGNVGKNTLTVMPSTVSGVDSLTNRYATGDTDLSDTDGDTFVAGQAEETDEELRDRATSASGKGGAATIDALIGTALNVTGVTSVTLFENDTDTDNTGSGGLPPVSFELVINGGDTEDIAQAIFDEKAATARDYGGANGTDTTDTATAINDQQFTIHFSRPTVQTVDISLDLVHDGTYAGDKKVRDAIVKYIGGTDTDGSPVVGLDVGEDVNINRLESRIMDVTGVVGVDSSDTTYTPSTTSDSNGLEVISIGSNEVAETDGTDGSITISKTQI